MNFKTLPKVDLHRHLEGSLRPETLWEFHQQTGSKMHASLDALRAEMTIPPGAAPGFQKFLKRFETLRFPYGDVDDLERCGREAVEDAAADGVVHLELRFSPVFFARRMLTYAPPNSTNPLPLPTLAHCVHATYAIVRGANWAALQTGISVSYILTLGRDYGLETNRPAADLLETPFAKEFVAVDIAGNEAVPLAPLAELFEPWRAAGKKLTFHAGEAPAAEGGPGASAVREAIEQFHVTRIGHGVRAIEDPNVVELLRERGTPLEVCLTSNIQTGAAKSYAEHPLRNLLAAGVHVTLNSDDPTINGITLSHEYERAEQDCGLSKAELLTLAVNSAQAAFLPAPQKAALVQAVEQAWRAELL